MDQAARRSRPSTRGGWAENLEAVVMALVVAVLFKYFVVEAYKIPTGSMQPTLMGWQNEETGGGVFDRILVDKASYHWRDPDRFEIVVFRFPLDRSKNFIKRLWGLPGDHIRFRHGDVWFRLSENEDWEILRRPRRVQQEMWLELFQAEQSAPWTFDHPESWSLEERDLIASSASRAKFPGGTSSVRDRYIDGYPPKLGRLIEEQRSLPGGNHTVGDLRIEAGVVATASTREVRLELTEGSRSYIAILPGPAYDGDQGVRLLIEDSNDPRQPKVIEWEGHAPLKAGRRVDVAFENLDDRLSLELDGERLEEPIQPAGHHSRTSGFGFETVGGGASFRDLTLYRDVYFTAGQSARQEFIVPEGQYMMLGDNTLDSRDSRGWRRIGYSVSAAEYEGEEITGSRFLDQGKNPERIDGPEGEELLVFRDEHGERHVFPEAESTWLTPGPAPFVPREMILGRALLVFWPYVPSLDVYRLRWIR